MAIFAKQNPMAKLILDNELIAEAFFEDACLLGIMAPLSDYHFCNLIKQDLGFDLRNDLSSEIAFTRKKREYFFSVFKCEEPNSSVIHYVYSNKCDGEYLLPEFKHLDYVWLIHGSDAKTYPVQPLIQAVRSIAGVQLIVELTNEKIKNKQHLVL